MCTFDSLCLIYFLPIYCAFTESWVYNQISYPTWMIAWHSQKCNSSGHLAHSTRSTSSLKDNASTLMPSPDPEQVFFRNMPLYSAALRSFCGGVPCLPFVKSPKLEAHQVSLKSLLPSASWHLSCIAIPESYVWVRKVCLRDLDWVCVILQYIHRLHCTWLSMPWWIQRRFWVHVWSVICFVHAFLKGFTSFPAKKAYTPWGPADDVRRCTKLV